MGWGIIIAAVIIGAFLVASQHVSNQVSIKNLEEFEVQRDADGRITALVVKRNLHS
jgi:hypothetical protein